MDLERVVRELKSTYDASWTGMVTKLSAPWTKEAEDYLRAEDFVIIGSIDRDPSVIGLEDGVVVELYR